MCIKQVTKPVHYQCKAYITNNNAYITQVTKHIYYNYKKCILYVIGQVRNK